MTTPAPPDPAILRVRIGEIRLASNSTLGILGRLCRTGEIETSLALTAELYEATGGLLGAVLALRDYMDIHEGVLPLIEGDNTT